jgi:hypothetical protein
MNNAGNANAQQPNQPPPDPTAGRQRQQPINDPLVPVFGEPRQTESPTLGFGQRDAASQSPTIRGQGGRQRDPSAAQNQANQQAALQAARNANTVRQSATYDSLSPIVRNNPSFSWFFEYDTDRDGQLSMVEYRIGRGGVMTDSIADEFRSLDRNGDGFVTVEEALATIREWDEQEALKAKEQQVVAGPQVGQPGQPTITRPQPGAVSPNAGNPPNPNFRGGQPGNNNRGSPNMGRQPQAGGNSGNQGGRGQGQNPQSRGPGGGPGGRGGGNQSGNNPGGGFGGRGGGRGGGGGN